MRTISVKSCFVNFNVRANNASDFVENDSQMEMTRISFKRTAPLVLFSDLVVIRLTKVCIHKEFSEHQPELLVVPRD